MAFTIKAPQYSHRRGGTGALAHRKRLRVIGESTRRQAYNSATGRVNMDEEFLVTCPYCGEQVEIYVEPDVKGSFVQDCEVCCNPWRVRVVRDGEDRYVDVRRADGSE